MLSRLRSISILSFLIAGSVASGQMPQAGDRDPSGRVLAKVVVTLISGSGTFAEPASGVRFVVVAPNGDRTSMRTDDAGVASAWVYPGRYRFYTPEPYYWRGNEYAWDTEVPIRAGTGIIRLSQSNASRRMDERRGDIYEDRRHYPARRRAVYDRCCFRVASVTEGLYFAPHLLGMSLKPEGEEDEDGGGFGFAVGYGITRLIAVYLNLDAANLDIHNPNPAINGGYTLGQGDLGVQFNFGSPGRRAIPYLRTAFTGRVAFAERGNDEDVELSGPAFTIGGGLNYYLRPKLALDVGLDFTGGKFDEFKVEGDKIPIDEFDAGGGRFHVGLTWYPFASVGDRWRRMRR